MKTRTNGGFTLIELVVVIALLGILAAFAIPRFASLESEARTATILGLAGSVRSASTLAHGLFLATGSPATVTMEGATIANTNGYPDATDIDDTLVDTSGFNVTVNGGSTIATFAKTGASGTCEVTYTEAGVGGVPSIQVDSTGC